MGEPKAKELRKPMWDEGTIAVYCAATAVADECRPTADVCNLLLEAQRSCRLVDDETLRKMELADERLCVGGESFRCVIVPGARAMPLATFRKLCQFAAAGGLLIFVEPAPSLGLSPEETETMGAVWPGLLDAKHVVRVLRTEDCLAALEL